AKTDFRTSGEWCWKLNNAQPSYARTCFGRPPDKSEASDTSRPVFGVITYFINSATDDLSQAKGGTTPPSHQASQSKIASSPGVYQDTLCGCTQIESQLVLCFLGDVRQKWDVKAFICLSTNFYLFRIWDV
ncbi:hypothetical protein ACV0UV_003321, partial [Salmonella enterica subsp. enterica serovar Schwarzengrund]